MTYELDQDEHDWIDGGMRLVDNPIVRAYMGTVVDLDKGELDEEDGMKNIQDVLARWVYYMATGNQEVSWYRPIMEQANAYFLYCAGVLGVEYTPGMVEPEQDHGNRVEEDLAMAKIYGEDY